jgi:hypothetical protein
MKDGRGGLLDLELGPPETPVQRKRALVRFRRGLRTLEVTEQWQKAHRSLGALRDEWRQLKRWWNENRPAIKRALAVIVELGDRYQAALELPPDDPLRNAWEIAASMPLMAGLVVMAGLRRAPGKRGRPRGLSDLTKKRLAEMEAVLSEGSVLVPTAAARVAMQALGFRGDSKGAADHLVRLKRKKTAKD